MPSPCVFVAVMPQYLATFGDVYRKDVDVHGVSRHVTIDDTAGQVRCVQAVNAA